MRNSHITRFATKEFVNGITATCFRNGNKMRGKIMYKNDVGEVVTVGYKITVGTDNTLCVSQRSSCDPTWEFKHTVKGVRFEYKSMLRFIKEQIICFNLNHDYAIMFA